MTRSAAPAGSARPVGEQSGGEGPGGGPLAGAGRTAEEVGVGGEPSGGRAGRSTARAWGWCSRPGRSLGSDTVRPSLWATVQSDADAGTPDHDRGDRRVRVRRRWRTGWSEALRGAGRRGRAAARAGRRAGVGADAGARQGSTDRAAATGPRRCSTRPRGPSSSPSGWCRCWTRGRGSCSTASSTRRSPTRGPAGRWGSRRCGRSTCSRRSASRPTGRCCCGSIPALGRARAAGRGEAADRLELEDEEFFDADRRGLRRAGPGRAGQRARDRRELSRPSGCLSLRWRRSPTSCLRPPADWLVVFWPGSGRRRGRRGSRRRVLGQRRTRPTERAACRWRWPSPGAGR